MSTPENIEGSGPRPAGEPDPMLLEQYLDGLLDADRAHELEAAIARDPGLQSRIQLQRDMDAALKREFDLGRSVDISRVLSAEAGSLSTESPLRLVGGSAAGIDAAAPNACKSAQQADQSPSLVGKGARGRQEQTRSERMWSRIYSAAAILIVGFAGLWLAGVIDPLKHAKFEAPLAFIEVTPLYERKVANGFTPDWFCETDEQFAEVTGKLGQALLMRPLEGVAVVGWSYYEPVMSKDTLVLLARVQEREVLVVMDKASRDRRLKVPGDSGLSLHRREMGEVVLYEVTPLGQEKVLPLFYEVEKK